MSRRESERFETAQWVPFSVELVFAFFASPPNLPHLMPPRLKLRIEDMRLVPPPERPLSADPARRFRSLAAGVGSELAVSFRVLPGIPVRLRSRVRIVEFAWNSHFLDEQIAGPFALFRHRHGIEAEVREGVEGTRVSDRIEYALPGGVLGGLGTGRVRRELEKQFAYRQQRLPEILATASAQAMRGAR